MPRLNPFIDRLFSESARELTLASGAGAVLAAARGEVPLIRQALTRNQVVGAVAEIVPDDQRAGFPRAGLTVFPYAAPAGAVEVRLEIEGGSARVVVVPRPGRPDATPAEGFSLPGVPAGARQGRSAAPPPSARPLRRRDRPRPLARPRRAARRSGRAATRAARSISSSTRCSRGAPPTCTSPRTPRPCSASTAT